MARPLRASTADVDSLEFTTLDLMFFSVAADAENLGGFVESNPAVGDLGHDAVADGLVDPDPPRRAGCQLFAGEESVAQPSVDGDLADTQEAFGFSNGDHHDRIIVVAADSV